MDFSKLGLRSAKTLSEKTKMSARQIKKMKEELKSGYRTNVYPNSFDADIPYRVSVKKGNEFHNHGSFKNLEVASMVGTLCGIYHYGENAILGEFDQGKAEDSAEMDEWLADERNLPVIEAAIDAGI